MKGTSQHVLECLHVSCSARFQDESVLAQLGLGNCVRPCANPGQVYRFEDDSRAPGEEDALRKTVEVEASTATLFIKEKCEEKTYRSVGVNATTHAQP